MSTRRTFTSGGLASAIGVCLAILAAGTLVVFSVIAARVGLEDPSRDVTLTSPREATENPPAAITFPSTEEVSEEDEGTTPAGDNSLIDIIGAALNVSSSTSPTETILQEITPEFSGLSRDLLPDFDFGGLDTLSPSGEGLGQRNDEDRNDAASGGEGSKNKDEKGDKGKDQVAARRDDDDEVDDVKDDDDDDPSGSNDEADSASGDGGLALGHSKANGNSNGHANGHSKAHGNGHSKAHGKGHQKHH
jgi:hypothetical protein